MSPREQGIRKGHREWFYLGDFQLCLYFEPYYEKGEIRHGFTVDRNHISHRLIRVRFDTLEEADAAIQQVKDELAVSIAKQAFGLN